MSCVYCMEAPDQGKCIRDSCQTCCNCGREIEKGLGPLPLAPTEQCGCDKRGDRTFFCTYHQGREDEREEIVKWLREVWAKDNDVEQEQSEWAVLQAAERIGRGEHHSRVVSKST